MTAYRTSAARPHYCEPGACRPDAAPYIAWPVFSVRFCRFCGQKMDPFAAALLDEVERPARFPTLARLPLYVMNFLSEIGRQR